MPVEIAYQPLFSVQVEHNYLLDMGSKEFDSLSPTLQNRQKAKYRISEYISFQPTLETDTLLKRHRCRIRSTPEGFQIFAATTEQDGTRRMERPLPPDTPLYFLAQLNNFAFLSQANLPELLRHHGLLFSNRHEHTAANQLQLTRPLAAFDPSASYQAGDLCLDDSDTPTQLFEAKTDLAPAASPAAPQWLRLPAPPYENGTDYLTGERVLHAGKCYEAKSDGQHSAPPDNAWTESYTPRLGDGASKADRAEMRPPRFQLSLGSDSEITFARAILKDSSNNTVWQQSFFNPNGEPLHSLEIDASSLAPDFYTLELTQGDGSPIPDQPSSFFRLPDSISQAPFALVEIKSLPSDSTHALFDEQGNLNSPTFHIRFRKRHAYWRYLFHGDTADYPPADTGPLSQEDPQDPTRFVTTEPLPLTTAPYTLGNFGDTALSLPPPPPNVTREADRVVSQTFIHV